MASQIGSVDKLKVDDNQPTSRQIELLEIGDGINLSLPKIEEEEHGGDQPVYQEDESPEEPPPAYQNMMILFQKNAAYVIFFRKYKIPSLKSLIWIRDSINMFHSNVRRIMMPAEEIS